MAEPTMNSDDPPTAMDSKNLLDLPAELLEVVADFTDQQSLKSLRQVCRELHAAADRAFIKTFFTHRCQIVSKYALQTLVSITAVPRLCKKLESLSFFSAELKYGSEANFNLLALDASGAVQMTVEEDHESYQEALMQRKQYLDCEGLMKSACSKVENQLFRKDLLPLITKAFSNLQHGPFQPAILVGMNKATDVSRCFGLHELGERLRQDTDLEAISCTMSLDNNENVVKVVLSGLADSGYAVQDLTLPRFGTAPGVGAIFQDEAKTEALRIAFKSLSSLDIGLWGVEEHWNDECFRLFGELVKSTALEKLEVDLGSMVRPREQRVVGKFATIFSHTQLKLLELRLGATSPHEVVDFLKPHKHTLQVLKLVASWVHEKGPDGWRGVFKMLAEDFSLGGLAAEDLFEGCLDRLTRLRRDYLSIGFEETPAGLAGLVVDEDLFKSVE